MFENKKKKLFVKGKWFTWEEVEGCNSRRRTFAYVIKSRLSKSFQKKFVKQTWRLKEGFDFLHYVYNSPFILLLIWKWNENFVKEVLWIENHISREASATTNGFAKTEAYACGGKVFLN